MNQRTVCDEMYEYLHVEYAAIWSKEGKKIAGGWREEIQTISIEDEKKEALKAHFRWASRISDGQNKEKPRWSMAMYDRMVKIACPIKNDLLLIQINSPILPANLALKIDEIAKSNENSTYEAKENTFEKYDYLLRESNTDKGKINSLLDVVKFDTSVVVAKKNGEVVYVNDKFLSQINKNKKEIFETQFNILATKGLFQYNKKITEALDSKRKWKGMINDNTSNKWFNVIIAPFEKVGNNVNTIIVTYQDITEYVKSKEMLQNFIGRASHEIKTPIQPLINYVNMAEKELISNDDAFKGIKRSTNRLLESVNELLRFNKLQKEPLITKQRFSLDEILRDIVKEARIECKIPITTNLEKGWMSGDVQKIKHVFYEVISNAKKFTKKGYISIKLVCQDEFVIITITDTGIGMSEKIKEDVFKKIHDSGETGMGLYVTKQIVEAHEGTITIKNNPNHGTSVKITMPLKSSQNHKVELS
ncbi:PAS domain-containing sensor histidine kinase [Nitrosopumilus sp. Nsub]|uniref:PAS domain-containing sensor histidine kinase n=1 Tax=Nitrosopumilus sp. Nsub TaxID=1776294 RepID=UPI000833526A|nr:PAS domain-containing sensor histidine kinase [Nitrosopumilus sp. Nsub]